MTRVIHKNLIRLGRERIHITNFMSRNIFLSHMIRTPCWALELNRFSPPARCDDAEARTTDEEVVTKEEILSFYTSLPYATCNPLHAATLRGATNTHPITHHHTHSKPDTYLRGMKREEFVAPIPARPWATGL